MKKVLLLLALFAAFYGHARITFSEPRVIAWLADNSVKSMSGDSSACDNFADDVTVSIAATGSRGTWEVEGGKNEICGYLKQASAALTVMQASTNMEFTDVEVDRGGFPWLQARVTYKERTTIQAAGLPRITSLSDDTLVLVRTLSGLKIRSIDSKSTGGL